MFKLGKPKTETHYMLKPGFAKDITSRTFKLFLEV